MGIYARIYLTREFSGISHAVTIDKSRLYHSLEWYTRLLRVYITGDYVRITHLFHDRIALAPRWAYEQRDTLVTLQWSGLWDVISLQTLC